MRLLAMAGPFGLGNIYLYFFQEKYKRLWNEKVVGNEFGEISWENGDDILLQALEVTSITTPENIT